MPDSSYVAFVLTTLSRAYPHAHIALRYSNPWELLVAVILSAQCTDKRVNIVTETLFEKYPTLSSYVQANREEFEQDIKPTGFFRNKAKHILSAATQIQDQFDGTIPRRMSQILTLPGVARKTANVVLGNAYGVVEGIAVDTHVHRISQRLRLVSLDRIGGGKKVVRYIGTRGADIDYYKDANPNSIERELMNILPKDEWFQYTYFIIDHGRAVCKARKPQCRSCVLKDRCPTYRDS